MTARSKTEASHLTFLGIFSTILDNHKHNKKTKNMKALILLALVFAFLVPSTAFGAEGYFEKDYGKQVCVSWWCQIKNDWIFNFQRIIF